MVLFAVSASCRNIWSGPEVRHCKVHNGLTLITRPSPRRAIACTFALGRCVLAYLTSFDELRCHGRRGPAERLARSPDEISPNVGDGLKDQAAAVWPFESAGLAATS